MADIEGGIADIHVIVNIFMLEFIAMWLLVAMATQMLHPQSTVLFSVTAKLPSLKNDMVSWLAVSC